MAGTLVANTINTDTGLFSTNNAYTGIAKAWVNFNGTNGSINNSFNVSSVTYNSTGSYNVNFTTAMPNANYVLIGAAGRDPNVGGTSPASIYMQDDTFAPTTSAFRLGVASPNGLQNQTRVFAGVVGN